MFTLYHSSLHTFFFCRRLASFNEDISVTTCLQMLALSVQSQLGVIIWACCLKPLHLLSKIPPTPPYTPFPWPQCCSVGFQVKRIWKMGLACMWCSRHDLAECTCSLLLNLYYWEAPKANLLYRFRYETDSNAKSGKIKN